MLYFVDIVRGKDEKSIFLQQSTDERVRGSGLGGGGSLFISKVGRMWRYLNFFKPLVYLV